MKPTRLLAIASVAYIGLLFLPWQRLCSAGECYSVFGWQRLEWAGLGALAVVCALDLGRRYERSTAHLAGYLALAVGLITAAELENERLFLDSRAFPPMSWVAYFVIADAALITLAGIVILANGWSELGTSISSAVHKLRNWRFGSADPPSS